MFGFILPRVDCKMVLVKNHPTGIDEYICPVCGRHQIVSWQPFSIILLDFGDPTSAAHPAELIDDWVENVNLENL